MRIVKNAAQCKICLDIVESVHRHDFKRCKCGEIFVDGGKAYFRQGAKDLNNFIFLGETCEGEKTPEDYWCPNDFI
ncbi:MAG: hypothetical protein AABY07_01225 [Nanoarchaeota archaeon]